MKKYISYITALCTLVLCVCLSALTVYAEYLPCQSAIATGHYRHPLSGIIEDSGGESSYALGQSMVSNVVDSQAFLETAEDGSYLISLRFHLMNSLSDIKLAVQHSGDTAWQSVSYDRPSTGNDIGDLRFSVSDTNVIIRAECMVDAMGRYVIFYITLDQFSDGNLGNFVQTQTSVQETVVETPEVTTPESDATISDTPVATVNTISSKESEKASAVVSQATDIFKDVEGLSIGGSAPAKTVTQPTSATTTVATENDDNATQNLNISKEVWLMFFILVICANIVSGLILMGIHFLMKQLWSKFILRERTISYSSPDDDKEADDFYDTDELYAAFEQEDSDEV